MSAGVVGLTSGSVHPATSECVCYVATPDFAMVNNRGTGAFVFQALSSLKGHSPPPFRHRPMLGV